MIYQAEITTPANTSEADPLRTILKVTKGLIYKMNLYAPHGAMGLHYLQVYHRNFQLWPTSPGRAFRGDGFMIDFDDIYFIDSAPYELVIKTWNFDNTYEHIAWLYVGQVSEEAFMMRFLPGLTYEKMLEVLDKLAKQQQEERAVLLAKGSFFEGE